MDCFPNDVRAHLLTESTKILERWHNAQTSFGLFEEDLLQYMLSMMTNPMMLMLYLAVKPLLAVGLLLKVPHILIECWYHHYYREMWSFVFPH